MKSSLKYSILLVTATLFGSCRNVASYKGPNELKVENGKSFLIYFADGYNNDTVSLKLNGASIFSRRVLKKLTSLEPVADSIFIKDRNTYIKYDHGSMFIKVQGRVEKINPAFVYSSKLEMETNVNGKLEVVDVFLSNGKYIFLDLDLQKQAPRRIRISQYRKLPTSE